jgi:hypothetical protein
VGRVSDRYCDTWIPANSSSKTPLFVSLGPLVKLAVPRSVALTKPFKLQQLNSIFFPCIWMRHFQVSSTPRTCSHPSVAFRTSSHAGLPDLRFVSAADCLQTARLCYSYLWICIHGPEPPDQQQHETDLSGLYREARNVSEGTVSI